MRIASVLLVLGICLLSTTAVVVRADRYIGGKANIVIDKLDFNEADHISFFISSFDTLQMTNSNFTGDISLFIDASKSFTVGKTPQILVKGCRFTGNPVKDKNTDVYFIKSQVWVHGGTTNEEFTSVIDGNTWFNSFLVVANMTAPHGANAFSPFTFSNNVMILGAQIQMENFGYDNVTCPSNPTTGFPQKYEAMASQVIFCGLSRVEEIGGMRFTDNKIENLGTYIGTLAANIHFTQDAGFIGNSAIVFEGNTLSTESGMGFGLYFQGGVGLSQYSQFVVKKNTISTLDGGFPIYIESGGLFHNDSYFAVVGNTIYSKQGVGIFFNNDVNLIGSTVIVKDNKFDLPWEGGSALAFWDITCQRSSNISITGNTMDTVHFAVNVVNVYYLGGSSFTFSQNTVTLDGTGPYGGAVIGAIDYNPVTNELVGVQAHMNGIENSKFIVEKNTFLSSKNKLLNGRITFFAVDIILRTGSTFNIVRNDMDCFSANAAYSKECDVYQGSIDEDYASKVSLHCNTYNDKMLSTWSCLSRNSDGGNEGDEQVSNALEFCPAMEYYTDANADTVSKGGRTSDPYMIEEKGFDAIRTQSVHYYPTGNGHWRDGNVQVGVEIALLDLRDADAGKRRKHLKKPCGTDAGVQCPLSCTMATNCSGFAHQLLQHYIYSTITSGNTRSQLDVNEIPMPLAPMKHNCTSDTRGTGSAAIADVTAFAAHPSVTFHCYKNGAIRIFGTGVADNDDDKSNEGLFLVWEGMSGIPDAYLGVTFECSPCLPISEALLNPQPIAVIIIAILKSVLVVYICIHVSKKWKFIPSFFLSSVARAKQEYWHSASATSGGTSEVLYPDEVSIAELESRLKTIINDFKLHNSTHGETSNNTKVSSSGSIPLPPGFAAFYAENLTFGGLRIPVVNCTSEVAATVVGMMNVYERWMPTELDTVSVSSTSLGKNLNDEEGAEASYGSSSNYQEESSREVERESGNKKPTNSSSSVGGSGVTMTDVALVDKFTKLTVENSIVEARRILIRYIDGPQMQRVVMTSHKVRICYIPPTWVLDVNAVAVAILFITSISDAYVVAPTRYTWIYFRMFNSTITATLLAGSAIRALATQRLSVRRLYTEKHILFLIVILFPALFSHVLVGAIVYIWLLVPAFAVGILLEVYIDRTMPKATDHAALLATASAQFKKKRNVAVAIREKIALLAFEYPIVEHMFRLVGRLALLSSIVVTFSLVFNWTQGFVYFHADTNGQSSTVSQDGYGGVIGAMFHDADARSNVCTVQQMSHTISQWWMTMASLFGPY